MYSISEMQDMLGINASTLRYYEKEGILPEIGRNEAGRRVYTEEHLEGLKFIICLKETGMSIEDIKNYMQLAIQGDTTIVERREVLLNHGKKVEQGLAQIQSNMERIIRKIGFYDALVWQKEFPNI